MAYRWSTGRQASTGAAGTKDFSLVSTGQPIGGVAAVTTKSASGPSRGTADHAGGNGAKGRGLRLPEIHAAEIRSSGRMSLGRSRKDGGATSRWERRLTLRSRLGSLRQKFSRRPEFVSAGRTEFSTWVQAGAGIVAD